MKKLSVHSSRFTAREVRIPVRPQTRTHSDFNEIVYHGAPVSHWMLNETGSDTTASDSVGGNNGTLNNFSGTYWVTGKVGNALELDGSDDKVDLN